MVPAMIYLIGMPTQVVVGTSLFQITFVTAVTTFLHAFNNQTVDVILALAPDRRRRDRRPARLECRRPVARRAAAHSAGRDRASRCAASSATTWSGRHRTSTPLAPWDSPDAPVAARSRGVGDPRDPLGAAAGRHRRARRGAGRRPLAASDRHHHGVRAPMWSCSARAMARATSWSRCTARARIRSSGARRGWRGSGSTAPASPLPTCRRITRSPAPARSMRSPIPLCWRGTRSGRAS